MEEEGRRRLAVRAGDPHNLELARRFAEEEDGSLGHRLPHVGHDELRDFNVEPPFDDERGRPGLDRVGREVVPVGRGAADAEEESPGRDRTRVVGEVANLDGSLIDDLGRPERRDEALQVHRRGGYRPPSTCPHVPPRGREAPKSRYRVGCAVSATCSRQIREFRGCETSDVLTASLPTELERALADATRGRGSARVSVDLTRRYRDPATPSGPVARSPEEVRAYAAARLPATYAAARIAVDEVRSRLPSFEPASLLDLGAGPGTAAWAAAAAWPSLANVTNVEPEPEMRRLGADLARSAPSRALADADWFAHSLPRGIPPGRFDLVTLSYVLGEIDDHGRIATVECAWDAAAHALVVVEPGTPGGYARVLEARDRLIELGAAIVAPCPHDRACPLAGTGDWCHFAVRLARTRAHREAKDAQLGHEDEKFSDVVAPARARRRLPRESCATRRSGAATSCSTLRATARGRRRSRSARASATGAYGRLRGGGLSATDAVSRSWWSSRSRARRAGSRGTGGRALRSQRTPALR